MLGNSAATFAAAAFAAATSDATTAKAVVKTEAAAAKAAAAKAAADLPSKLFSTFLNFYHGVRVLKILFTKHTHGTLAQQDQ